MHSSLGKRQQAQSRLELEEWTRRRLEGKIIRFLTFKSNKVTFKMTWLTHRHQVLLSVTLIKDLIPFLFSPWLYLVFLTSKLKCFQSQDEDHWGFYPSVCLQHRKPSDAGAAISFLKSAQHTMAVSHFIPGHLSQVFTKWWQGYCQWFRGYVYTRGWISFVFLIVILFNN